MMPMTPIEKAGVTVIKGFLGYLEKQGMVLAQEGDWNEEGGYYDLTTITLPPEQLIEQYILSTRQEHQKSDHK